MRNKLLFFFYFFFVFSIFITGQESKQLSINEIKEKLLAKQESYNTYQSYFKQLFPTRFKLGKILIKKPNKIKIIFYKNFIKNIRQIKNKEEINDYIEAKIYIYEKKMYFYFLTEKVVFKNNFKDKKNIFKDKVSFLKNWVTDYDFEFDNYERQQPILSFKKKDLYKIKNDKSYYHLKLIPKDVTLEFNNMNLWINENSEIIRSKIYNANKVVNDLYFFNIIYNKEILNKEMEFIVPANVQVIDNYFKK